MKETHSRVRKTQNQMPYLVFHKMGHIEQHAQHLNIFEFKHREYLLLSATLIIILHIAYHH